MHKTLYNISRGKGGQVPPLPMLAGTHDATPSTTTTTSGVNLHVNTNQALSFGNNVLQLASEW